MTVIDPPIAPRYLSLFHADWSRNPKKRWVAQATRAGASWQVTVPRLVGHVGTFLNELFTAAPTVLAGFDFPIGLPKAYGQITGLDDFLSALKAFGTGEWEEFYSVAETRHQISRTRPFYPRGSRSGAKQLHLLNGLGIASIDDLRRQCEKATSSRRAACPLFWTLGGNQVGKAAISGWTEVIVHALRRGAGLWPFEGSLASSAREHTLVLAETYPAEAYDHVGIKLKPRMSKRRRHDRREAMARLLQDGGRRKFRFSPELASQIRDGFGSRPDGEDRFDALIGALGMIEVVDGHRAEKPVAANDLWEGWIVGQNVLQGTSADLI